jgi:hypothetical protein
MGERRKFRRFQLTARATAFTANEKLESTVEDLSGNGALLRVERPCETGRFARLLIAVSPDFLLEVDAIVARVERNGDEYVWGMAFVSVTDAKTQGLLHVLAEHARAESWRPTKPLPSGPRATSRPPSCTATSADRELRSLYRAAVREIDASNGAGAKRTG